MHANRSRAARMCLTTTAACTCDDSYLVAHGARLDLVNCDGELPLDLAYQFAREGDASDAESEASDDEHDADAGAARRALRASRASSKSSKSSGAHTCVFASPTSCLIRYYSGLYCSLLTADL